MGLLEQEVVELGLMEQCCVVVIVGVVERLAELGESGRLPPRTLRVEVEIEQGRCFAEQ